MTKDFIGSITVDLSTYPVTGVLSIRGRRINGTLRFTEDEDLLVPVNFSVSAGLVTFQASAPTLFISPDGDLVKVTEIQSASTTIDLEGLTIEVTEEDCTLNGEAALFSLSLEVLEDTVSVEGVENVSEEEITTVRKTLTPVRINQVGNQLDHFGSLLSLPRLLEERNSDYRNRIIKAANEPSGSTYNGLVWAGCKELGLEISDAVLITRRSAVEFPERVVFSVEEDRAVIYSNWVPLEQQSPGTMPTIEQEVVLTGLSVGKLVDWVNFSSLFKAKLLGSGDVSSRNLLIGSTNVLIQETLAPSERMKTKECPLRGSLLISRESGLQRETPFLGRSLTGDYSVDYSNGFIQPLFIPDGQVNVSYMSNTGSITLKWAPVRVTNITSEGGQNIFFNQVERDFYRNERGRYVNGIPTNEMFSLLREVMDGKEFPQFWGE